MNRRELLQILGLGMAAGGCGGGGGSGGGATDPGGVDPERPPNVLMISIDDLNDWVGFLGGHPQVRTPAMDALAARSTVFERAYCTAPVCSASRAGALTGLSAQSTRVFDNTVTFKRVNPGKPMLMDMLAGAGFATGLIGKVDHNFELGRQPRPAGAQPFSNKQCSSYADLGEGAFDWGPTDGEDSAHPDYRFAQDGIDFLNQQPADQPFFLAVGFVRTHVAWYVPRRFFDMYPRDQVMVPVAPADDLDDLGPTGRSIALKFNFQACITGQDLWADAVQAYLASISWVDSQIARLMAALDAGPHANNTVVVLWSDHGFHLGEKFHWHKQTLWEHATRVPFLVHRPGQLSGARVSSVVSLRDMVPTVLDLCDVDPAYTMDGVSLKPLIAQPGMNWDVPALMTHLQYDHAVRTNQWRYIRYRSNERELYDETADPAEYRNLSSDSRYDATMAALDALLPPRV